MAANSDVGPQVLDDLFQRMMIDREWSVRSDRSFTWWGHHLAQRVWAEPCRQDHGYGMVCVRAETDLLCQVPDNKRTTDALNLLNAHASLSSLVWYKDKAKIKLACSAYFHRENANWLRDVFYAAATIQAADAETKLSTAADLLASEPDVSQHPGSGPRETMDDLLNVIEGSVARVGQEPSRFTEDDFASAADSLSGQFLASADKTGLTAEFPFFGAMPSAGTALGLGTSTQLETALLQADCEARHPQLGSGVLLLLKLPLENDAERSVAIAQKLNLAEATEWVRCHQLGGWCCDISLNVPAFCCFVPSILRRPALLEALIMSISARVMWSHALLFGGEAKPKHASSG
jgi:hypothetical protein